MTRHIILTLAIAATSLTLGSTVEASTEPPEPAPTVVCTVPAGIPGTDGAADGFDSRSCSAIMSCLLVDGIPGVDGSKDGIRVVVCQGVEL